MAAGEATKLPRNAGSVASTRVAVAAVVVFVDAGAAGKGAGEEEGIEEGEVESGGEGEGVGAGLGCEEGIWGVSEGTALATERLREKLLFLETFFFRGAGREGTEDPKPMLRFCARRLAAADRLPARPALLPRTIVVAVMGRRGDKPAEVPRRAPAEAGRCMKLLLAPGAQVLFPEGGGTEAARRAEVGLFLVCGDAEMYLTCWLKIFTLPPPAL